MTALSGVTAISFDVDNTLWDFDEVMRGALRAVLEKLRRSTRRRRAAWTSTGWSPSGTRPKTD